MIGKSLNTLRTTSIEIHSMASVIVARFCLFKLFLMTTNLKFTVRPKFYHKIEEVNELTKKVRTSSRSPSCLDDWLG